MLANRLRKWDTRCSTSQNSQVSRQEIRWQLYPPLLWKDPRLQELHGWRHVRTVQLFSMLPSTINPLISVLISSLISNCTKPTEGDKYNVSGAELRRDRPPGTELTPTAGSSNEQSLSWAKQSRRTGYFGCACPQGTWDEWLQSFSPTCQAIWKTRSPTTSS